jgi:NAD(P)-dependent dehydrogenase (short-subunit alcohol dehydrogenase family)
MRRDIACHPRSGAPSQPGSGVAAVATGAARGMIAVIARRLMRAGLAVAVAAIGKVGCANVTDDSAAAGGTDLPVGPDLTDETHARPCAHGVCTLPTGGTS